MVVRKPILMPKLGFDMEDGKILNWLVQVGGVVKRGDSILEVETDKTTLEVEALATGILVEVIHGADAVVAVGELIGYLEVPD